MTRLHARYVKGWDCGSANASTPLSAKDSGAPRISREAAMAKLYATDRAQEVIDKAVQIHGGDGVRKGHVVERLYREIRALRIYEGASDVQKVIIARQTLANASGGG